MVESPDGPTRPMHACAFFDDDEDEYGALLPFSRECAQCGEQCLHFVDERRSGERAARLSGAGIGVSSPAAPGAVELRTWPDVYLHGGRFDMDAMLGRIDQVLRDGRRFGGTRLWANMEWVLQAAPGSEDLVEYESRLNPVMDGLRDIVVCVYRPARYSASVIMDVLRAHPMVWVDGELRPNPMYVPPQRFLADLRQRIAPRAGIRSGAGA